MSGYKRDIDIEDFMIWVYQHQKADAVIDHGHGLNQLEREAAGLEVYRNSADGCYTVAQTAILGTRVDYFGPSCALVHPDAELAHDMVKSMRGIEYALILECAKHGNRPDWMPGAVPMLRPKRRANGKMVMICDKNRNVIGCELDNILDIASIEFARKMYMTWWNALAHLADALEYHADMLKSFRVTRPAAPFAPWKS